jgi:hypothetical protein
MIPSFVSSVEPKSSEREDIFNAEELANLDNFVLLLCTNLWLFIVIYNV